MSAVIIPVAIYQAVALKAGLKLYRTTGIKPNRQWTPTNMLKAASRITGEEYKRGQFLLAEADLQAWIDDQQQMDKMAG